MKKIARPDGGPSSTPRPVAKGPYKIEPRDTLVVRPAVPLPGEATNLILIVDRDGAIDVGPAYGGSIRVAGLTLAAARKAVEKASPLKNSEVALGLYQTAAECAADGPALPRTEVRAPRRRLLSGIRQLAEPAVVPPRPSVAVSVGVATVMPPTLEPGAPPAESNAMPVEVARREPLPDIVIPSVPSPERTPNRPRRAEGVSDTSRLRN